MPGDISDKGTNMYAGMRGEVCQTRPYKLRPGGPGMSDPEGLKTENVMRV